MDNAMTQTIRIVFMGTPAFSLSALQVLADAPRIEVAAVVTQPDRPAGRGQKLTPPPIKTLGEQLGIPTFQTASIKKDEPLKSHLKSLAPDFLTQEILDIPKMGTVNAHASLLPEFRGANPIQQAILQGKKETGITTMLTELGVDTGPMLLKHVVQIGENETMGELTQRLSEAVGPLLVNTLVGMVEGTVHPEVQSHEQATHAPKCAKEDALLNWAEPAEILHRKIRGFNPAPGAATFLRSDNGPGERIKILRAQKWSGNSKNSIKAGLPGDILAIIETGILVQTGDGPLEVTSLQPAGKREMPARDWALGCFKSGVLGGFQTQPTPQPV
jgi:methionyl-tRNA formyltransferase